jgi:hypothetical protein
VVPGCVGVGGRDCKEVGVERESTGWQGDALVWPLTEVDLRYAHGTQSLVANELVIQVVSSPKKIELSIA